MVRFENVGLSYGAGAEVLTDLSFTIARNSFQFLTGPSGAGKTSLLRLILLSLKPTRGLISLFDRDTSTLNKDQITDIRRRIGVVFQDFRLLDHLTTYENVALPLFVQGREERSYRAEVTELLKWVGLGDKISAYPPVLSGGEKAARGDRARPDCSPRAFAGGRTDRQRRSEPGKAPPAPVCRAEQVRHVHRHCHA